MQLFFVDKIVANGDEVVLQDEEIRSQMKKVLRLEAGDTFCVQDESTRYELSLTSLADKKILGTISSTLQRPEHEAPLRMLIAMPNKQDKLELMVQKLTEIGVDEIIFWPAERSVIKVWNNNKEERLTKIMKEALEQSRGWKLPHIGFWARIEGNLPEGEVIVFDKQNESVECRMQNVERRKSFVTGIVGPEGGLTSKDYQQFPQAKVMSLGATVLRMETAAIVGAWRLKNGL